MQTRRWFFQLASLPSPLPDLPKLQNLDMAFQTLPGGPILFVRLRDSSQLALFETLCRDIVAATADATTETEALERSTGRTFRWHRLLRGGTLDVLSPEEQKGTVGELHVLRWLISGLGAKAAVAAWTGPSGAPERFRAHGRLHRGKGPGEPPPSLMSRSPANFSSPRCQTDAFGWPFSQSIGFSRRSEGH